MNCKLFFLIIFLFTNLNAQDKITSKPSAKDKIEKYLKKSDELINVNLDSALFYSKKANQLIDNLSDDTDKVDVYRLLGNIYLARGNYVTSLEYYLKAAKIIETKLLSSPTNQKYLEYKVELFIHLGNVYQLQHNFGEALKFYDKALVELDHAKLKDTKKKSILELKILNNSGGIYLKKKNFDKALSYFEKASKINETINDVALEANLFNNLGICYLEKKESVSAIYYFEEALKIRLKTNDQRGISQCYNNLGKAYGLRKEYAKAQKYFDEALQIGQKIGNSESIIYSLESLTYLFKETKHYEKAYFTFEELTTLKDSLFNAQTVKRIADLEMNYKLDQQKQIFELDLKRKEAEKQKDKLLYYTISAGLFSLLAIAVLWIYLQKTKIKNIELSKEKLTLSNKNISLEKDKLQEELAFQSREMTTKMMYLLKKNELINSVSEKLIELKKNATTTANQKAIQDMIVEMRQKKDDDIWNEFETYFTKVHPEFYSKLNQLFPNLTPNEKKLCAFLRLNMSTKDISAITYQSINSITVSRSRLRKKLNIQGEDINLINFLMNL